VPEASGGADLEVRVIFPSGPLAGEMAARRVLRVKKK
jgi:hypothetical protein